MKIRSIKFRITLFCILAAVSLGWWLSNGKRLPYPAGDNGSRAREYYDQLMSVQISGTVEDDQGGPLDGASVEYIVWNAHFIIGRPTKPQPQTVLTDGEGKFSFVAEKPERIFIQNVSKDGYEAIRSDDDYSHDFARNARRQASFRLRKVGRPAFLLQCPADNVGDRLIWVRAPETKSAKWSVTNLQSYYELHTDKRDLEVAARYDEDLKSWEITYRGLSKDGGVILSKQDLYMAPVDGYQREVSFRTGGIGTDAHSRQSQYYLYMKTRSPVLYAKLRVYQLIGQPREYPQSDFDISVKSWTNPYGERNFEPLKRTAENFQAQDAHTEYCLKCINENRRADPKHLADLLEAAKSKPTTP